VRLSKPCSLRLELLDARCLPSADVVLDWNELLLQSLSSQPPRVPLARNMALVHVAMFDAVNAIDKSYEPYATHLQTWGGASQEAAAAQAAHDTLVALYPSRQAIYDAQLAADLDGIPTHLARPGIATGREVAREILALRADDGAAAVVNYTPPNNDPGQWQPTPPNFQSATNAHVPLITPFAIESSSQFRPPPPPGLTSPEYAGAFNEAKLLGASDADTADRDGNGLPDRTADQTLVAELWRVPLSQHQVWNRIAQDQARDRHLSLPETARLFALLDMALNDGLETSFESKYHYQLWRPVTAIQRADEDGNPDTVAEPTWMTEHPTTPPYPTYAGNAATFGAASATVLAAVLGRDDLPFQVDWSPYTPLGGPRSYPGFWAAADEQARSRVYGGIHFQFDSDAGQGIGRNVAHYILDHFLTPEGGPDALRAATAAPGRVTQSLRGNQVQPLLTEALARWQAAGVDTSALNGVDVHIADLGGRTLGRAANGVIVLDDNAAGWGWFVDRTRRSDSEFTRRGNQGEKNRMDLLTVLEHEVGHLLGYDHASGGLMQETLTAGTRVTVGPAAAKPGDSATLISWSPDSSWIGDRLGTGKRK